MNGNAGSYCYSMLSFSTVLISPCPGQHVIVGLLFFFLVLPVYCYQPISLHPRAHMLSHVIPWTSARQTPLSIDFSRQEYWSGLPFPSPHYCRSSLLVGHLVVILVGIKWHLIAASLFYSLTSYFKSSLTKPFLLLLSS